MWWHVYACVRPDVFVRVDRDAGKLRRVPLTYHAVHVGDGGPDVVPDTMHHRLASFLPLLTVELVGSWTYPPSRDDVSEACRHRLGTYPPS